MSVLIIKSVVSHFFFISSLPILLSSLPLYGGGLTYQGLFMSWPRELAGRRSPVRGSYSQSCLEVAWVGCVELLLEYETIYLDYVILSLRWYSIRRQYFLLMGFCDSWHSDIFRSLDVKHFCELFITLEKDLVYGVVRTTVSWRKTFKKQVLYHLS